MQEKVKARKIKNSEKFQPPSLKLVENLTAPLRCCFTPQFFGLENITPDKPALYVSNHTLYGFLDGTLFMTELYKEKGIWLRSLVDNMHYKFPVWKNIIEHFGMVRGTRLNCAQLMNNGENILLYPGGGRETFKLKDERYKLIWKRRTGFALMAIEHGYDIIPVANVGGDDAYNILWDSTEIMDSFLGRFLVENGISEKYLKDGEYLPPISKGMLWTGLPKPVKLYTSFGKRIDTTRFKGNIEDEQNLWQLRREVECEISKQFIDLLEFRKEDKLGLLRRMLIRF